MANLVDKEWRKVLKDQLNNNLLMNSPKGKTAFACGVAFVLSRLQKKGKYPDGLGLDVIHDDLVKFTDAYMVESDKVQAERLARELFGPPPGGAA